MALYIDNLCADRDGGATIQERACVMNVTQSASAPRHGSG